MHTLNTLQPKYYKLAILKMNSVNIIAIYFITLAYVALGDIIIYRADTEEVSGDDF